MNLEREIWEGWRVQDFIDELTWEINAIMNGKAIQTKFVNKLELKRYCMSNQPHYKKYIPEVVQYFADKYNLY